MKKKSLRKVLAASVAAMLMCAPMMAMSSVSAAGTAQTIVITAKAGDTSTHTYQAYQIFKGSASGKNLGNIVWGENVNTSADGFLTTIQDIEVGESKPFASCTSAADVAAELSKNQTKDNDIAKAFANCISDYLTGDPTDSIYNDTTNDYTISPSAAGYYLVQDKNGSAVNAKTRYILEVTDTDGEVRVNPKMDYPTLDKTVKNSAGNYVEANTAAIGDIVEYQIITTVPDMTGYNKYYYVVNDTLSSGLDYYTDSTHMPSVVINKGVSGKEIVLTSGEVSATGENFYVSHKDDAKDFKVVLNNFIQYNTNDKVDANDTITITYYAKLTDYAKYGTKLSDGEENLNINTAYLTYSNDPNFVYGGGKPEVPDNPSTDDNEYEPPKPYEPDDTPIDDDGIPETPKVPTDPTSDTPEDKVYTYTSKLTINKIDGESTTTPKAALAGAGFTLYKYDETIESADKYALLKAINPEATDTTTTSFNFEGLAPGQYKIVETKTPAGYNTITPIEFTITGTVDGEECTWSSNNGDVILDDEVTLKSSFKADIENNMGSILPSTGGIGTTIFYISGGLLVLGSAVLLVTKKRMSLNEEK